MLCVAAQPLCDHFCFFALFQAVKRPHTQEEDPSGKRARTEGSSSGDDDAESRIEQKLRQLQEIAAEADNQRAETGPALGSSPCPMSRWEQVGKLMLFTAAGVTARTKVSMNTTRFFI